MRKSLLLLCVIMIVCGQLFAGTVGVETAQTVALNFFKLYAPPGADKDALTATLKYTKTESNGVVDFYVFDIAPIKGFVIVTGYDNLLPVIGFSTESSFKTNFQNIGLNDWVEASASRINYAVRAGAPASAHVSTLWSAYKQGIDPGAERATSVAPLAVTTWDQENDISTPPPYLYNLFCPYNSSEKLRCVTGCVATAMAQIMAYWKYPATGTGSYSYTSSGYGTQSVNFGATSYPWSIMPSVLTDNTTGAQDSAVDLISYDAGVAVAMAYGTDDQDGSGAYVIQSDAGTGKPCAQQAYPKYFGYNSSTIQGLLASSYTASAWTTLLDNELNAGRIIQYAGQDPSAGGHTWLVDGYNTSGQYHMNFGWGGADNGYFSITAIDVDGYKFNSDDEALIGIEPGTTTTTCSAPTGLTTSGITTSGATFGWTAASGATSYTIQYQVVGAASWTTATSSTNSYTASGLTSGTNYQWEVATVCSGGTSSFTGATAFETTAGASCGVPTGLGATVTGTTAAISWTAVSGVTSYSLEYEASGASGFTTVTGITTNSYSLSGLTSCTSYTYAVQAVCSGGSSAYSTASSLTTTGCSTSYCASSSTNQEYEVIYNVTLGSIDNTTTAQVGYANYTNLSTNLTGGSTYTISLEPAFTGTAYKEYFTVYIDYNHDGLFTDAGDLVAKAASEVTVSKKFTVPTTAINGPTRMRVQMQYGAYETNPCATFTYGGVQDYTVNISGGSALTVADPVDGQVSTDMKLYPNPAQNDLSIQFGSSNNGTVKINIYNVTGQRVISDEKSSFTGTNLIDINTSQLSSGVYIFEMENNGVIQHQKFTVAR